MFELIGVCSPSSYTCIEQCSARIKRTVFAPDVSELWFIICRQGACGVFYSDWLTMFDFHEIPSSPPKLIVDTEIAPCPTALLHTESSAYFSHRPAGRSILDGGTQASGHMIRPRPFVCH